MLPWGEKTRRLIGTGEMPLLEPVILSVSASISERTSSKSTNFFPLQCRNSAYSADGVRSWEGLKQCAGGEGGRRDRRAEKTGRERSRLLALGGESQRGSRQHDNRAAAIHTIEKWRHTPALLLTSCKMRGLRVTMPDPRGRKSLR